MATSARPHVTSTTDTRPTARATRAVTTIATAAIASGQQRQAPPGADHQCRSSGSVCAAPGRTHRIWSTPIRPVAEGERATDEVEPPDADHLLADEGGELRQVCLEVLPPPGHGVHVVLAQRVHVAHLEAPSVEVRDGLPDRTHVHVRCDERLDERPTPGMPAVPRHLLHEHAPARPHRPPQHLDVRRVVALADVLAHLQRPDRVEVVALGDLAVVLEPDLDPSLEPALADPLRRRTASARPRSSRRPPGRRRARRRAATASPSRTRRRAACCPGPRPSLVQTRSSFARCADSTDCSGSSP